ncbi:MAG: phosphatidylglycerophosphatase A [Polyangia bacterium]
MQNDPAWERPLAATLATWFGVGNARVAPGSLGTLAAVPLGAALLFLGPPYVWTAAVLLLAVGTWAAGRFCRDSGTSDDQRVVIDEVVGYLVTLAAASPTLFGLALGYGLFRLFDIWKPWPIRLVDRRVHGGFGVMADDVMAGLVGAPLLWLATIFVEPALRSLGVPLGRFG